jgi:hypothetical protein
MDVGHLGVVLGILCQANLNRNDQNIPEMIRNDNIAKTIINDQQLSDMIRNDNKANTIINDPTLS